MWLCTKFGFFSVVQKTDGMHVRARTHDDLLRLRALAVTKIGAELPTIQSWPGADYRFRMVMQQWQWFTVAVALFSEVDYSNFKDTVANSPGQSNKLGAYHELWRWGNEWQHQDTAVERLINSSVDDLRSSLPHCSDRELLTNAFSNCEARGEKTKVKLIARRINQLDKEFASA